MENNLKTFTQFVNESSNTDRVQYKDGDLVDMPNFAYLSNEQLEELDIPADIIEDEYTEVQNEIVNAALDKIVLDIEETGEEYFDITVNLEDSTFTLYGIYDASYIDYMEFGSEGKFKIYEPIQVDGLPITLPLPKKVKSLLLI